ncbi:MAG: LacI family transcriptional regulator [Bryobacterales bacterium]|jgi:DNA-binding LacI/PurR family transcriptional regulator|nr:LacI family transcriptional regulator [Bryobacterales bacterium]
MPTIKEVAARAGVSVGTVSNVLSGLSTVSQDMRRRVEAAIQDLGYRPDHIARSLKTRRTQTLGMVISDIVNPFFADVIDGAQSAASEHGFTLSIINCRDSAELEKRAVETLCDRRVDGLLVVVSIERGCHEHLQLAIADGTPVVCLDREPLGIDVDTVTIDNVAAGQQAVEHLIATGHRVVAYVGGSASMYVPALRQQGYLAAMKAAGLRHILIETSFDRQGGRDGAARMLSRAKRPTAALCGNLQVALGLLQEMRSRGLSTPEDVAVATFDHFDWLDVFRPQLTSIVQPAYRIGYEGAQLLLRRVLGQLNDSAPQRLTLPTQLRIAESTAGFVGFQKT